MPFLTLLPQPKRSLPVSFSLAAFLILFLYIKTHTHTHTKSGSCSTTYNMFATQSLLHTPLTAMLCDWTRLNARRMAWAPQVSLDNLF